MKPVARGQQTDRMHHSADAPVPPPSSDAPERGLACIGVVGLLAAYDMLADLKTQQDFSVPEKSAPDAGAKGQHAFEVFSFDQSEAMNERVVKK
jgi:hypothetical protein